jgi:hypothetical protein
MDKKQLQSSILESAYIRPESYVKAVETPTGEVKSTITIPGLK